ncbi:MAG: TAXI family TRAP transporter solute-binding subunit [Pseudomonadota bacterium]
MKIRSTRILVLAFGVIALNAVAALDPAIGRDRAKRPPDSAEQRRMPQIREKLNAWTVGLAGGLLEGAPIRFATEIARVADDGDNLHVLPIVTRGPTHNVEALLYLRGVDAAIINADVLDEFKKVAPNVQQKISYVLNLFPSELHIFVRPEIRSVQDLAGKRVNFNTPGTAAAYSGPLIFERLKINVEKLFIPHPTALEQLRKGDIAAVVFITSKPVDAFAHGKWDGGYKFLPVPYQRELEEYYLPAVLDAKDYPQLIGPGEQIQTISVPTVLAAYNFAPGSDRYQRLDRLTTLLFDRVEKLHAPGFHPKWKEVNLSATVPGLSRFAAAQAWLDRAARARAITSAPQVQPAVARPDSQRMLSGTEEKP